eukprot:TRINITY_DN36858_c0_g1_i1.p1 TRINITY_DN36858_c0_g1~~TRINITY_DN36858_c0_g1_i1.p1  ORF type:complete len:287 (+),score=68.16 TRINITY_DN36858_c0_g1_i1:82-942(+)
MMEKMASSCFGGLRAALLRVCCCKLDVIPVDSSICQDVGEAGQGVTESRSSVHSATGVCSNGEKVSAGGDEPQGAKRCAGRSEVLQTAESENPVSGEDDATLNEGATASFFVEFGNGSAGSKVPARRPAAKRRPQSEPEGLRRFTVPQSSVYQRALREIEAGKKDSCWMWYMIPTPPYMVNGVEKGSARNQKYALRSDDEVREYLKFEADGVNLRKTYLGITTAIRDKLRSGCKVSRLIGPIDEPKLRSSVKLFERVTRESDAQLNDILIDLLGLLREKPDDVDQK